MLRAFLGSFEKCKGCFRIFGNRHVRCLAECCKKTFQVGDLETVPALKELGEDGQIKGEAFLNALLDGFNEHIGGNLPLKQVKLKIE